MTDAGQNQGSSGFRSKVFTSAKFSLAQFLSKFGLRLFSTIVLTRLLAPEIYGIFAIVLVYRYILEMFSDLGIRSLILTKEGDVDARFLGTCWTVSILRGSVILFCSMGLGVVIATMQSAGIFPSDSVYAASQLPFAIAALGGVSLLNGCQSVNRYVHERNMTFGRVTLGIVAANILGLVATITLAYALRSVWALVFGAYAQSMFTVLYSHLAFTGQKLRLILDRASLNLVVARGKWIIGHSILTALSHAADRLLLGLVMSSTTFGFYFIARQILDIIDGFLISVHGQMGLQIFAHILRATPEAFRRNYYKYRLVFDAISGLSAGGLFILAPLVIDLIYDDRYQPVAAILQILILGLPLIGPLILREAYSAERKFREMTVLSLVSAAALWTGLILALFVIRNQNIAFIVIALHRLPEAALLWWFGACRGWVRPLRESLVVLFFIAGTASGWAVLTIWNLLT